MNRRPRAGRCPARPGGGGSGGLDGTLIPAVTGVAALVLSRRRGHVVRPHLPTGLEVRRSSRSDCSRYRTVCGARGPARAPTTAAAGRGRHLPSPLLLLEGVAMALRITPRASSVVAGVVLLVVAAAATYTAAVDRRAAATPVVAVAPVDRSADLRDRGRPAAPGGGPRRLDPPGRSWGLLYVEQARLTADPPSTTLGSRAQSAESLRPATRRQRRRADRAGSPGERPTRLRRGRRPGRRGRWRSTKYDATAWGVLNGRPDAARGLRRRHRRSCSGCSLSSPAWPRSRGRRTTPNCTATSPVPARHWNRHSRRRTAAPGGGLLP